MTELTDDARIGRRRLWSNRGFIAYCAIRAMSVFALEFIGVAIGWQIYDITNSAFILGLVGLTQFLPSLLLFPVTGAIADRKPRRTVMIIAILALAAGTALLGWLTYAGTTRAAPIFGALTVIGLARAFWTPPSRAIINNVVPRHDLAAAIRIVSSLHRIGLIAGAFVGGILYGLIPAEVYFVPFAVMLLSIACILVLPHAPPSSTTAESRWEMLSAGGRYILGNRLLLGAVSLDLFAVILSGATALLPVFARDILQTDATGLGVLRSATAVGALGVAIYLTWKPIAGNAGTVLLTSVAAFGAVTAAFGLSTSLWLSAFLLALAGGLDLVSVIVRETLIQLATPDSMRGRVGAINGVVIGASNEVGEFRAGTMAAVIGPVAAVVIGGVGAMVIAGLWWKLFPEIVKAKKLEAAL